MRNQILSVLKNGDANLAIEDNCLETNRLPGGQVFPPGEAITRNWSVPKNQSTSGMKVTRRLVFC